jgi:hypothetical protein
METSQLALRGIKRFRPYFKVLLCAIALLLVFGSASAQTNLTGVPNTPDAEPDLLITDIWSSGAMICYQVFNRGDAGTKYTFTDGLRVDNVTIGYDPAPILDPGERYDSCFNYSWNCSGSQDIILVGADVYTNISESNESNNTRTETWLCDQTAPKITSGPTVSDITTTSAKISWTTDEASTSLVKYDTIAERFSLSQGSQQPVQSHTVDLSGMTPATLYQYKVISADVSGNEVESDPGYFKTKTSSDTQKPKMTNYKAERMPGDTQYYRISIDAEDNDQIERVEFYLDGELIGIDYTPDPDHTSQFEWDIFPGVLGMDMAEFDIDHPLQMQAFDRFGNSYVSAVTFHPWEEQINGELEFPYLPYEYNYYISGWTVPGGTSIPLDLYASQYYEDCRFEHIPGPEGEMMGCRESEKAVDYIEIYIDSDLAYTGYPTGDYDLNYEYDWNIGGMGIGDHTIIAISHAGDLTKHLWQHVNIMRGSANLNIERTVTQDGHQFRIGLRINNSGTLAASLYDLTDNLDGLQPMVKSSTYYTVTSTYSSGVKRNTVNIDLHSGASDTYTLNPGNHLNIEYLAVPVLYREVDTPTYVIGDDPTELDYSQGTRTTEDFDLRTTTTTGGDSLVSALWDIQLDSDYLVVTNPCNLFAVNISGDDVNELLSGVAKLADAKDGILAYLVDSPSADTVDDAIETWGDFMKGSDGAPEHFLSNGYVLLVGETDIIPAHSRRLSPPWYVSWLDSVTVNPTDLYYADTSSNTIDPELNLGRIPGNNAARLLIPIETIIGVTNHTSGYDFDWSDALIVSGWSESRSGGSDHIDFADERNDVEDRLDDHVTDTTEMSTTSYGTREAARDAFFSLAVDQDIIHIAGHGNWDHLDDIWGSDFSLFPDPFDDANPFVYASSCLTGDYTRGRGLAERFLENGAGLYLGSTEVSYCCVNTSVARSFYNRWDPGEAVGPVIKSIKRDIGGFHADNWATGYYEDIWTAEYHLLGDPEYGYGAGILSPELAIPDLLIQSPSSTVPVSIPDYVLSKTDLDKDMAEIPGGFFVMMPGKPMVPSYSYVKEVAAGTVVQDVVLSSKTGMKTASGIDLVTFNPAEAGDGEVPLLPLADEEWFPTVDFDWGVENLPDGTSELHIVIYPFFYNSLTQAVNFYTTYQFSVITASSSVYIPLLDTDAPVYDPGDTVHVDLGISASGNPQTVTVSAAVYALGSYELVDGMLMDTLSHLSGTATYSLSWDSGDAAIGDYYVIAELHDLQGHLLDTQTEPFSLGMVAAEASNLSAPAYFEIGESVPLDFWFENTGTVPISGTAVIRVEGLTSGWLTEIEVPVTNLLPTASAHISVSWDSNSKPLDDYQVTAFVIFEGQTTPALTKIMETSYKLRLPLVRKK